MGLWGDNIGEKNVRLRFYLYAFAGTIAFASILYWRSQLIFSQEYVEFPESSAPISRIRSPLKVSEPPDELGKELNNEQN